ncbi:MAG: sigma-70 family RNA polymerase sigma factor [Acidimicrobiia bacterium]|nr:sigma-70 family RNA polymerase sigma factor [Acidimicrobiia bacterium]MDH5421482.1 sigma-70 family RNA polymerase sigma factor [Acidimicrobiia bacterium]MDH5503064.1 sigma-70 family RNA polymerase sigma factor [Acidimicrobiia bacterium]
MLYLDERTLEDNELVAAVADRDESALAEIYRRHGSQVFGLAKRVIRDEEMARDIAQDVFVSLWKKPEAFDASRGSLRTFLLAKTHSRSIDVIRSEASRRIREERDALLKSDSVPNVDDEVWQVTVAAKVRTALATIPERERDVIELAYFGGLTYREVAAHLGMAEGTVKSRIRSGLSRLQESMGQLGIVTA